MRRSRDLSAQTKWFRVKGLGFWGFVPVLKSIRSRNEVSFLSVKQMLVRQKHVLVPAVDISLWGNANSPSCKSTLATRVPVPLWFHLD